MGFTDRKPWTITEKDVTTKWGLSGDHRLHCYLCDKIAAVGDTFRWLYMNGHSPSPGNVMCCAGCDHVGIEDEIRASVVAWKGSFPGCDYEIRPAMKLAALEAELARARQDGERLEWKPISEAPRDGTPVFVGRWHRGEWSWKTTSFVAYAVDDGYTHWMAHPSPPEVKL